MQFRIKGVGSRLQRRGLSDWSFEMAKMAVTRSWQSARLGMNEEGGGVFGPRARGEKRGVW